MTYNNAIYGVDLELSYVRSVGRQVADLKERNGDIATVGDVSLQAAAANRDNVKQALALRIGTPIGTLPAHTGYGSYVYRLIGQPRVTHIMELLRTVVAQALLEEPRIVSVDAVDVTPDASDRSRVDVSFTVTIQGESSPINWVYPFYLESETTP